MLPVARTDRRRGLYAAVTACQRALILDALYATKGDVKAAAQSLSVGRTTLVMMIERLGLRRALPAPLADVPMTGCALCGDAQELTLYVNRALGYEIRAQLCKLCSGGLSLFRDRPSLLARAYALLADVPVPTSAILREARVTALIGTHPDAPASSS